MRVGTFFNSQGAGTVSTHASRRLEKGTTTPVQRDIEITKRAIKGTTSTLCASVILVEKAEMIVGLAAPCVHRQSERSPPCQRRSANYR